MRKNKIAKAISMDLIKIITWL